MDREQSVSRALREYGKRNRALEDVVGATRSQVREHKLMALVATEVVSNTVLRIQLRHVLDSLKVSEKRKTRAVTEASALKHDLVIEQCQRSAYVRVRQ